MKTSFIQSKQWYIIQKTTKFLQRSSKNVFLQKKNATLSSGVFAFCND